jgi:hypothetical protein
LSLAQQIAQLEEAAPAGAISIGNKVISRSLSCYFIDFDPEAEAHDVDPQEESTIDTTAGREHYIDVGYMNWL